MDPGTATLLTSGASAGLSMLGASNSERHTDQRMRWQQEWAEDMSSSAHQRETADLRAAGLNPILSVNAGASTPTPGGVNPGVNKMAAGIASAREAQSFSAGIAKTNAEIKALDASSRKQNAESKLTELEEPRSSAFNKIWEAVSSGASKFFDSDLAGAGSRKNPSPSNLEVQKRMRERYENNTHRMGPR